MNIFDIKNSVKGDTLMNSRDYKYKDSIRSEQLISNIKTKIYQLCAHPVYRQLTTKARIKCFISYHIFGVWDCVKLLKILQNKMSIALQSQFLECSNDINKLLNEIVFAQESYLFPFGKPNPDFANYLRAIAALGADSDCLWYFIESQDNLDLLKPGIKELVEFNLAIAESGTIAQILTTFSLGREQLTSQMFASILKVSKTENQSSLSIISIEKLALENKLKSELLALKMLDCLDYLCEDESEKIIALQTGLEVLELKEKLWNSALAEIREIS